MALVAILGSHFLHWTWLDPVGGMLVSYFVTKAGYVSAKGAILELAGEGITSTLTTEIRDLISTADSGFDNDSYSISSIRGFKSGPQYIVAISLSATSESSLEKLSQIESSIRKALLADKRFKTCLISWEAQPQEKLH